MISSHHKIDPPYDALSIKFIRQIMIYFLCIWKAYASSFIPPYALPTCITCHGLTGKAAHPDWPNLGGQHAPYLFRQLMEMKQGTGRPAGVMQAILASLQPDELQALAAYYAMQPLVLSKAMPQDIDQGTMIYRGGNLKKHISACIACHGPAGEGNALAGFPTLAGQPAAYTVQQLQAFKHKQRTHDVHHMMQDITLRMNKADMRAVANYIQGLHPRKTWEH